MDYKTMIDIHTHIIPGIDDGSPSMEESLEMAAIAADCGVTYLVATPHANQMGRFENFFSNSLKNRFFRLQQRVREEEIPLKLLLGMEIFSSWDMQEKIHDGRLIGLNGSRYYLVEWAFDETPDHIQKFLNMIIDEGKIPLIAHPERYFCVQENPALVYYWEQQGVLAQINKGSLFGKFGEGAERTAELLLDHDLVTCMGTDAHSPYMRTTFLADGRDYVADQYGMETARMLTVTNPIAILTNKPVIMHGRKPGV